MNSPTLEPNAAPVVSEHPEAKRLEAESESCKDSQSARKGGCSKDTLTGRNPSALYSLPGAQVEPEAAYWTVGPDFIHVVDINYLLMKYTTNPTFPQFFVSPYPTDTPTLDQEIAELAALAADRDNPGAVGPLSDFLELQPPPFGAIFNTTTPQFGIGNVDLAHHRITLPKVLVKNGRELARLCEIETPGLLHRHALNWLLSKRPDISPARQARIWMALDVALYSALAAAWYYKWAAGPGFSYRQRPYEYDRGQSFSVLFDHDVADNGDGDEKPRSCPCPSPGTPRHPAYPSGHSTYSAAASAILKYFFSDGTGGLYDAGTVSATDVGFQLDLLADNIGMARLWAGVHWRSDHEAGQKIGRAVAQAVIDQLEGDCIPPVDTRTCRVSMAETPPDPATLRLTALARRFGSACDGSQDQIPDRNRDGDI